MFLHLLFIFQVWILSLLLIYELVGWKKRITWDMKVLQKTERCIPWIFIVVKHFLMDWNSEEDNLYGMEYIYDFLSLFFFLRFTVILAWNFNVDYAYYEVYLAIWRKQSLRFLYWYVLAWWFVGQLIMQQQTSLSLDSWLRYAGLLCWLPSVFHLTKVTMK